VNETYPLEVAVPGDTGRPGEARVSPGVDELSALYHEGYHRFVRVAEAITRDPEEARDAVQDGFASALRRLDRYRGRGSFEGWVWRCVVNSARMGRRRSHRRAPTTYEAPTVQPEQPALREEISGLPERQRLVLFLRYFADLSYDGIAAVLDVSPGTVAATLNAAHRTLRRRLEEADDD
jgi:RNA polymerase sigma-70 factor (ECF subfamily)